MATPSHYQLNPKSIQGKAEKAWLKAQLAVNRHVQWHESRAEEWPCAECRRLATEETRTEAVLHAIERMEQ